nr:phage tail protein [uncultured Lachnoanaerobaculum sp.]
MAIEVRVDENDWRRLEHTLKYLGEDADKGLAKVVNKTAKEVKKLLAKQSNSEYATTDLGLRGFNNAMKVKTATGKNPVAEIISKDGSRELYKFKVSPKTATRKNGRRPRTFKAKVLKASSFKKMQTADIKAFVTTFKSGHTTLVERTPGKRMRNRRGKGITKHNMALKALYAVPVPNMLAGEHGYLKASSMIDDVLQKNIDMEIEKLLGSER